MLSLVFLAALLPMGLAQVVGRPSGFAVGTTGGGTAAPAIPRDNAQLLQWLTDDVARVIMIDRTFDFRASEGRRTETGCRPPSNTCGVRGQDGLNGPDWCQAAWPDVQITYNVAPTVTIDIRSNKSLVGVGTRGIIMGKGLRVVNAQNIIVQNIHFTDLNPQIIWGGDAIQLQAYDRVWVDHCRFSLIGRQMIVTRGTTVGRLTISNSVFDGRTSWSSSCNNQHYWTLLLNGNGDRITMAGNHIHDVSGRAPKVGPGVHLHAINNWFVNSQGHNFDLDAGANVLLEGNNFQNCRTPIPATAGAIVGNMFNVPTNAAANQCTAVLGRSCSANILTGSGAFPAHTNNNVLTAFMGNRNSPIAGGAASVPTNVANNAGLGRIGN